MQKPNNRDQIAIKLSGVTKKYTIHHDKPTLMEKLVKRDETFWALKDVNLTIRKGERVDIIGLNSISFHFKWKGLTFHSIPNRTMRVIHL